MENSTDFGFKRVAIAEKASLVKGVFDSVAQHYDLMNDAMSLGVHHLWKNQMMAMVKDFSGKLIDMAGGTGDITMRYYAQAKMRGIEPKIVMCDINLAMLEAGRDNLINNGIISGVEIACLNAESLPYDDMSFDYYTIAFGIRNVTDIKAALKEACRVLKPGGKFICLEFSRPVNHCVARLYDSYSFYLIPQIGQMLAGNKEAYQYLVESIRKFPTQDEFASLIREAGFAHVNYRNLSCGVTAIHYGYKI